MMPNDKQILIISQEPVGPQMAGPGIRYWEFARLLGEKFSVTLAAPQVGPISAEGVRCLPFEENDSRLLRQAAENADVTIVGGFLLRAFPFLLTLDCPLVVDAYIPYPLEVLELNSQYPIEDQISGYADALLALNLQFMAGDFFLCASERQRDLWLGLMLAQGRISPLTYFQDRTLRHLIDTVPFGLPEHSPQYEKPVLRGIHPGVDRDARIILWGGGIWQWLDPLTLIKALSRVVAQHPEVRLFFPGTRHPYVEGVPDMQMRRAAAQLSDDLGLTGRYVIVGDWVPYGERQNYLMEADLGASLHMKTLESRFAFRTRLLDYIWAGLPILASRGDPLAELVEVNELGLVVEPEDEDDVTDALLEMLSLPDLKERCRPAFEAVAAQLTWSQQMEPLLRFCHQPRRTADRQQPGRQIYLAWLGDLQSQARESDKARIAQLEEHVQTLQSIISARDAHIQHLGEHADNLGARVEELTRHAENAMQHALELEGLIEHHRQSLPNRVLRALKQFTGKGT